MLWNKLIFLRPKSSVVLQLKFTVLIPVTLVFAGLINETLGALSVINVTANGAKSFRNALLPVPLQINSYLISTNPVELIKSL